MIILHFCHCTYDSIRMYGGRVTEQDTQYVVSVRAFNDVDKGPVIYDLVYTASSQGAPCLRRHSTVTRTERSAKQHNTA